MTGRYDRIIIGAGIYGLYAALLAAKRGERAIVLERDARAFSRATYLNQARVHMGYHYPRSYSTAVKSAGYFRRFTEEFGFCVYKDFEQVYATSREHSWTNARQFADFCAAAGIRCDEINPGKYFEKGLCDGAFLTTEYTFDAPMLRDHMASEVKSAGGEIRFNAPVTAICRKGGDYEVTAGGEKILSPYVINASYASVNQITAMLGLSPFAIKYELCEIILCEVCDELKRVGITVMDGPFFSLMPFGLSGDHSLTSVCFTPHKASFDALPGFPCQGLTGGACSPESLSNCDECAAKPESAWPYMRSLAKKYLRSGLDFGRKKSLYSIKPILKASEIDDGRPTVVRVHTEKPTFVSVLSGKINTIYDIEEALA